MAITFRPAIPTKSGDGRLREVLVAGAIVLFAVVCAVLGRLEDALAIAIALPLLIAVARRPQRGVLAIVCLAPFDGLLDLFPHAGTLHSWKELTVGVTLLATFIAPSTTRAAPGRRVPGWVPGVIGLMAVGLVSAMFVGGNQAVTGFRIDFFYVLVTVAIWRCPLSSTDRDRLVTILMGLGAFEAVVAIAEEALGGFRLHALGFPYNTTIRFAGGNLLRAFGTFSFQAPLGYFLMLVLLVGISQALVAPGRRRNRWFVWSLLVMVPGLALTFERGAWLGFAAGLLYLGLRRHKVLLLLVPLAPLALLWLPSHLTSTATSSSSLGERSSGWSANLHQLVTHPLGTGIGATGAAGAKVASATAQVGTANANVATSNVYQPDNYYFKTIYELGVLGMWFLVLFLVAAALWCDRTAVFVRGRGHGLVHGQDAALAESACAFFIAAMVACVVATFFEIYPMDLLTWLLLGVMASCWCD